MNLDFSDDQKLLKEQVRKFLADKCPMKVVRRVLDGSETHADEVWKGLVELGVPGTTIPEEYGGLGLSPLELCVIAEEIGRAAAPVPFDASVVLATEALKLAGSEAQKKKWLARLANGDIPHRGPAGQGHRHQPSIVETGQYQVARNLRRRVAAQGELAGEGIVARRRNAERQVAVDRELVARHLVDGGPRAPLRFLRAHAALLVALLDVLRLAILLVAVLRFVSSWHSLLLGDFRPARAGGGEPGALGTRHAFGQASKSEWTPWCYRSNGPGSRAR